MTFYISYIPVHWLREKISDWYEPLSILFFIFGHFYQVLVIFTKVVWPIFGKNDQNLIKITKNFYHFTKNWPHHFGKND